MTTRRIVLAAGASLGATMVARVTVAEAQNASKTFVLVHGAWHGGWCWRRVSDLLERKGHKVFTPTLTGLGERSHLMSRDINLDTHIMDVVNVIKWEGLKDVCLVAHSYGGWPVSGAIEQSLVGPPVDLDGLFASLCRNFFATCCLLRHSGLLSFIFWPVGNDCTDELVQKV
jgi:hypothetical protein